MRSGLRLAALGGPETFSAQFAGVMRERYPEFAEVAYFAKTEQGIEAAARGDVDAACVPAQMSTTGFHGGTNRRIAEPGSKFHVIAEISAGYRCCLLGKPGAPLERVRRVLGHTGSSAQSRPWIEANLPGAALELVDTNSLAAGEAVLQGDGSLAAVGTPALARRFGLVELARDIDGGCIGSYWAISREPHFSEQPGRLVVAGRFDGAGPGSGHLSAVAAALASAGYSLCSVYAHPAGDRLYRYDCVLGLRPTAAGAGNLAAVRAALGPFERVRLAGAYDLH